MTLTAVAREAKVSPMTVSNFVNGKFRTMSEATRERVAAAVKRLGYRPDTAARSLRSSRHLSIGMIIVDELPNFLADGYTAQIVSGLGNTLNAAGYTLQLEGLPRSRFEDSALVQHVRTDGLCVGLSGRDAARRSMMRRIAELKQPFVTLAETPPRNCEDVCAVIPDDRAGGAMLTRHVLERGARRLLYVGYSRTYWKGNEEYRKGMNAAVAEFGRGARVRSITCGAAGMLETQAAVAREIAANGLPDAILGVNDHVGIATLKLLKSMGIEVPGQVLVTGYNAFDFWQYSDPLLTTIRSPGYELGRIAGQEMLRRLVEGAFAHRMIKLPVDLIFGEST